MRPEPATGIRYLRQFDVAEPGHERVSLKEIQSRISGNRETWLVTGAAGFIGSHLLEQLLLLDQRVVAVDNFATGSHLNLESVRQAVGAERYRRNCRFVEGDVRDYALCESLCQGADYVLHQAALSSVPLSLEDPLQAHDTNLTASLNLMWASVHARVRRFVYASSCAVYGDQHSLPHREAFPGQAMSPYAVGKFSAELYARNFCDSHGLATVGLRYFNIFGPRQSATGAYAAVIPSFVRDILDGKPVRINGDGKTSRDFCFVDNVVQANLLAATQENTECFGQVFNVASGEQLSILELYREITDYLDLRYPEIDVGVPRFADFRRGEVRHSLADISRISESMGYRPATSVRSGLSITLDWYLENGATRAAG